MSPVDQRKEMLLLYCKTQGAWLCLVPTGFRVSGCFHLRLRELCHCPLLLEPMGGGPIVQFVFSCCTHAHTHTCTYCVIRVVIKQQAI